MNYPIINSERCEITIATISDAYWLHILLNDRDVYKNIEGTNENYRIHLRYVGCL